MFTSLVLTSVVQRFCFNIFWFCNWGTNAYHCVINDGLYCKICMGNLLSTKSMRTSTTNINSPLPQLAKGKWAYAVICMRKKTPPHKFFSLSCFFPFDYTLRPIANYLLQNIIVDIFIFYLCILIFALTLFSLSLCKSFTLTLFIFLYSNNLSEEILLFNTVIKMDCIIFTK